MGDLSRGGTTALSRKRPPFSQLHPGLRPMRGEHLAVTPGTKNDKGQEGDSSTALTAKPDTDARHTRQALAVTSL